MRTGLPHPQVRLVSHFWYGGVPLQQESVMTIRNLFLFASLFALGCGEKTDEERLDDLEEACNDYLESYSRLQAECGLPDPGFTCAEQRSLTEESGCIDEAEAALECGQDAGFDSLTCEDDLLGALSKCEEPGTAWNECVGG